MKLLNPVESAKYLGIKTNTFAHYVRDGYARVSCSDDGLEWGFSIPNLDRIKNGERKREIETEAEKDAGVLPFFSMADKDAEKKSKEIYDRLAALEIRVSSLEARV